MKLANSFSFWESIIMAIVVLLCSFTAGLFIILLINSPGKPKPFVDSNGTIIPDSISEKNYVTINGVKLGFFIKGINKKNPVLLYLHGGMPDYFLTEKYPTGLDNLFTVVWLDQRGAGLSYNSNIKDNISIDDLISDTVEVTQYLRQRFSQDKIYLMAHSGGTYLGVRVIEKYPELYNAYIGVSQIVYQKLSEKKAYEYIIDRYSKDSKKRQIYNALLNNPIDLAQPLPAYYIKVRDYAMHDLGVGTMRQMKNVITGIFIPSLLFTEYSMADKLNLWKGKANSGISIIWNDISNHDLTKESVTFKIPVYFIHGVYDYTCSYTLAKQYYETIDAPKKGFYSLYKSAHSPIFEEPDEFVKILKTYILLANGPSVSID